MKRIVIVAGDTSGDLYGGLLAKKLKESFEIFSFAGPKTGQHSKQITNLTAHSVCGLVEVLSHLKSIIKVFKETLAQINTIKPDLIILIDFPDFNLKLAKELNKKFPLFYYVSPQVWAWRKKRVELIKQYVDKMIVIFKFEQDFYKKHGMNTLYFGHPLLEIVKQNKIQKRNIISFLPGSRKNEVQKHLPIMKKVKNIMQRQLPDYEFRIIRPKSLEESFYRKLSPNMPIVKHSYEAIQESKFIIASSGTATVEIAMLEVPYLIIYKINPISWHILKRIVNTKFVGMVNILSSKKIVEELLQNDANPKKIAQTSLKYLKNSQKYQNLKNELKNVRNILSPQDSTDKFASYIGDYLKI